MKYNSILTTLDSGVLKIIMNEAKKMNSVSEEMCRELIQATGEAASDPMARVVILGGSGKAFCAGGDLGSPIYDIKDPMKMNQIIMMFGQVSLNLRNMAKPSIAMVNGVAVGAGLGFALACDMRIAADNARFGHVYVNIGVQSDAGCTYSLPRLIGVAKACEMIFTGEIIDASQAEKIGLVNRVVPAADLEAETMKIAAKIARGPAFAIGMAKKSIYQGLTMDFASAVELEARAHTLTMLSDDMTEGIAAFKEKRQAKYK